MPNPDWAGKPYTPSNGTEGMYFTSVFCDNCFYQHPDPENERQCREVLLESLIGNQPTEWIYDSQGKPTCTKFKYWDWGRDNGDGYNEPPVPTPIGPNQLLIPFDITELFGFSQDEVVIMPIGIIELEN